MTNKLKLIQLVEEDKLLTEVNPLAAAGKVLDSLLSPHDFTKPVKGPVILYLTYREDSAKTFSDEKSWQFLKNNAKKALQNIPIDHLDSRSGWEDYVRLKDYLKGKGAFSKNQRKEISNNIDLFVNIENNINRAKVETRYVPEAGELVKSVIEAHSKTNGLSNYVKGEIDYDKLNLELEKIYFSFGNPHAVSK